MNSAVRSVGRSMLSARTTIIQQGRNSSVYKPAPTWKPPHMDEMPVPQGSWKTHYENKQKAYNTQLAAGIVIFLGTVGFIYKSEKFFFNYAPPPLPENF